MSFRRLVTFACATVAALLICAASASAAQTVVSLTFDDGTADEAQTQTMLSARGLHATYYAISGRVGSTGYLSADQLRSLQADGNEIGGHTMTHPHLDQLDSATVTHELCDSKTALQSMGLKISDLAYPFGGQNAMVQQIAQQCGYTSARLISGLQTPTACSGCAVAEKLTPSNPYGIRTPDSIKDGISMAAVENEVTKAQQAGGGWVPLVMHHVCSTSCDQYSISPGDLATLLDWLKAQQVQGTISVQTVSQVMAGGATSSGSTGTTTSGGGAAGSGSAGSTGTGSTGSTGSTGTTTNPVPLTIKNAGMEADANADGIPDCFMKGSYLNATSISYARVQPAFGDSWAAQFQVSGLDAGGNRKLVTTQDSGACAPAATAGHRYLLTSWYRGTAAPRLVAYYRDASGAWKYLAESADLPQSSDWRQGAWTTPALPAGATAISIGALLHTDGTLALDDMGAADAGA